MPTQAAIQFRPGPELGARLNDRAVDWSLTPNETARRLVILSDHQLSTDDYDEVVVLADALGGNGCAFVQAAGFLSWQRREDQ